MVKQVQLIDEYYEDEDDDELLFLPPDYYTSDERLVLIAVLMLLEQRYRLLKSMTPEDIAGEVEGIMDSFLTELNDTARSKVDSAVWDSLLAELIEWNIPIIGYVEQDTSMYPIMMASLAGLVTQLKYELLSKSLHFADNMSKDDFDITPNFKRAKQRLIDAVGNNLIYSKEKSHRRVLKFVYGDDMLYKWYHMNDEKVCDWCIAQGKEAPRRIDDWELDHPHGRCILEPVDNIYSADYYALLM